MHDKKPDKKERAATKNISSYVKIQITMHIEPFYFLSAFCRTQFVDFCRRPPGRRVVLFVGRAAGTMFAGNVAPIALSAFANDIHAGRKPAFSTGSFIETISRPAGLGLLEFVSGCFCRPAGFVAEAVGPMIERV